MKVYRGRCSPKTPAENVPALQARNTANHECNYARSCWSSMAPNPLRRLFFLTLHKVASYRDYNNLIIKHGDNQARF